MPFDRKEYMKEYRKKNKEKIKKQNADRYIRNKERINKRNTEWYKLNKDKVSARKKKYTEDNRERINEQKKEYRKTPHAKKLKKIYEWKRRGLICDNYSNLYDKYLLAEYCDVCNKKFNDNFDRCMDHDHDTGLFRQFLCQPCNRNDKWKEYVS